MLGKPLTVRHFFTKFTSLGGVESMLNNHFSRDLEHGVDSQFCIYLETGSPADNESRVTYLGWHRDMRIRALRRDLSHGIGGGEVCVAIYHTMWAMLYVADLDFAQRRILVLHSDQPDLETQVKRRQRLLDGIICVNPELAKIVRQWLPNWDEKRVTVTHYPVDRPVKFASQVARPIKRPLRIGYCGRLSLQQKRIDRLPALCAALQKHHVDYHLELAGQGPDHAVLENAFAGSDNVTFLGRLEGDAYWEALARWDFVVFVSDFEGTPIGLIEAMSVGVLPLYPDIGSGGEAYVAQVNEAFVYSQEDFDALARTLVKLNEASADIVEELRQKARSAVKGHLRGDYFSDVAAFASTVHSMPRQSLTRVARGVVLMSWFRFRSMGRLGAVRRTLRALFGR
jgi:glycosyltransferase involved in cell wall biosynthesis